jgi:hypothetical protein
MATEKELLLRAPKVRAELDRISAENEAIFRHMNYALDRIFHPKTDPSPGASDLVAPTSSATPAQGSAPTGEFGE